MRGLDRNTATGHGLTLVAGLPLPATAIKAAQQAQAMIEALAPSRFIWYGTNHLHVTLRALLRTRYRCAPPLRVDEVPKDLTGFASDLANIAAASPPWGLDIQSPRITPDGLVHATVLTEPSSAWWTQLEKYGELDREELRRDFHLSLGYVRDEQPAAFIPRINDLKLPAIGECAVDSIWLVHYANRTLNRIVGRIELKLGQAQSLTAEQLVTQLGLV